MLALFDAGLFWDYCVRLSLLHLPFLISQKDHLFHRVSHLLQARRKAGLQTIFKLLTVRKPLWLSKGTMPADWLAGGRRSTFDLREAV